MAIEDVKYFANCKLVVTSDSDDDEGKTVVVTNSSGTQFTATIPASLTVNMFLPNRDTYTAKLIDDDGDTFAEEGEWTFNFGEYKEINLTSGQAYVVNVTTKETTLYGKNITITYGTKTKYAQFDSSGNVTVRLFAEGEVTFTATDGTDTTSKTITIVPTQTTYSLKLNFSGGIFGVEWAGGSSPVWSRTDDAEEFTEPVAAIANGNGSSPFDDIYPWNEMEIVDDATVGKLVKIPKYYYKWTRNGATMKLQISDAEFDGSHVSPAHADRGDGTGERDVVYVGRYHCASTYKSTTGVQPAASITRANFRTSIHNLGSTIWQYDYAMYWTIMMLYLVEYANWNSQAVIGYGCSPSGSKANMGGTDGMTYHTGTSAAARTTYGWTQYRHIEGLWDNVYDWCDGIYFSGANVYCIKNPASFSDTSGGTLVGTRATSSGYISAWNSPSASGFEYALYPNAVAGSDSTYVADYCDYIASGVVLRVGGYYSQHQVYGAFCLDGNNAASISSANVGSRLQKLP